jgi:hypothetical protein
MWKRMRLRPRLRLLMSERRASEAAPGFIFQ